MINVLLFQFIKMNASLALLGVLSVVLLVSAESYTTKHDSTNIETIIGNSRIFDTYFRCFKKVGPCSEEARRLDRIIPDALMNDCAKCNEVQKMRAKKVILFLSKNYKKQWQELLDIYDPKREYYHKYEHYFNE